MSDSAAEPGKVGRPEGRTLTGGTLEKSEHCGAGFLRGLFQLLDGTNVRYGVRRFWHDLGKSLAADLDLVVHPEDAGKLPAVFQTLKERGYRTEQRLRLLEKACSIAFTWREDGRLRSIALHIDFEPLGGGEDEFASEAAEAGHALHVFLGNGTKPSRPAVLGRSQGDDPVAVMTNSSDNEVATQLRLDGFHSVRGFALLPSMKTTRWLTPVSNRRWALAGMQIYKPYARRGRWLKNLLLAATRAGWLGWARHRVLIGAKKALPLEDLVVEATGEFRPVFSLSLGTPGRFRKLTVQVMRPDGEVTGYIKLPLSEAADERLRKEAQILRYLWTFSELRPHIPNVLHAGEWGHGYVLFETAGPTVRGPSEFGPMHEKFLGVLWGLHQVERLGDVLTEEVATRWRRVEPRLDAPLRTIGAEALGKAAKELSGRTVACGVMHGDFAPWNTSLAGADLFVYDWESARLQAPLQWDIFHFKVQVASLMKKSGELLLPFGGSAANRASFLLYLLDSVCELVEEEAAERNRGIELRQKLLMSATC